MNVRVGFIFSLLFCFSFQAYGMNWFFGKSDNQKESERKTKEREKILSDLQRVDLGQLEDFIFSEKYEYFLEKGDGSGVGRAVNFLWDCVRESPEAMKKEIGIPFLSGVMVDGMLEKQDYVRMVFEQESQQDVSCKKEIKKGQINSLIGFHLVKALEGAKQVERKAYVQKTGQICAKTLFKTVSEKKDVLAGRFTRKTKVPGLKFAVKTVLSCVANNKDRWGVFFSSISPMVFAKHLLSEQDFKKLQ